MNDQSARQLISFIESSPTSYHAIDTISRELDEQGFTHLHEGSAWKLEAGGKYYVTRNCSSIIAFKIPGADYPGFQMTMSHSDSPSFKLKENYEVEAANAYLQLDTERYGGAIFSSWLDRPLQIVGRVLVQEGNRIVTRLVRLPGHVVIPNLAIHMNRETNSGFAFNPQVDTLPLYGSKSEKGGLLRDLAKELHVEPENILGKDLLLINDTPGCIWGPENEYYSCPRIDNLGCAFTTLRGFEQGESESVSVYAVFDNEEIGSSTKQGAGSTFLYDVLHRIHMGMGRSEEEFYTCLNSSFMVSADNAHAVHPNHPEKADAINRPVLNEGLVIKQTASQSYATDGASGAIFRAVCKKAGVPAQSFANRSDMPGGSTMGCIISSHISVNTVDIGLPQLAMHSSYETAGTADVDGMIRAITEFYNTSIRMTADGEFELRA